MNGNFLLLNFLNTSLFLSYCLCGDVLSLCGDVLTLCGDVLTLCEAPSSYCKPVISFAKSIGNGSLFNWFKLTGLYAA